jgi:RNA polymerase sigma factor (sigma-70 family)
MKLGVFIPAEESDPVAVALNDASVHARMNAAARAFLGRQATLMTATQRVAEAEVIVQEAASRAWARRSRFDRSKDVVFWLVGFVRNVVREFGKKRGLRVDCSANDCPQAVALDTARTVDDIVCDKLLVGHLLAQLTPAERAVIQMKYEDDLTCAEIGERIGVAENAVRVRVFRVIGKLKLLCGVTAEGQP